ncbi:hypothetical protein PDIDSM_3638 [Penicillium digitatum]|nr:hypothetical protein PDIDSM_3638 [Penicillium digitatum]
MVVPEARRSADTVKVHAQTISGDYNVSVLFCSLSDGGRTAWSSTVTVQGQNIAARYWYDGQFINNAKEDAAEVALKTLNQQPRAATVYQGQLFPQATSGYGRGAGGF